ncbi:hypothetical protein FB567DRAFT_610612 [Paraphoma chrysanthemicola]|uniref:Uncharacterized protein n=1 Tax=Paraphoma chrysanthemicola TaxID=798071 RepID=A0A8K0VTP1_9PLEO|nr:hypothetical protein FB567DRAFT_610612 [Paraphoma chrysanthemicola]
MDANQTKSTKKRKLHPSGAAATKTVSLNEYETLKRDYEENYDRMSTAMLVNKSLSIRIEKLESQVESQKQTFHKALAQAKANQDVGIYAEKKCANGLETIQDGQAERIRELERENASLKNSRDFVTNQKEMVDLKASLHASEEKNKILQGRIAVLEHDQETAAAKQQDLEAQLKHIKDNATAAGATILMPKPKVRKPVDRGMENLKGVDERKRTEVCPPELHPDTPHLCNNQSCKNRKLHRGHLNDRLKKPLPRRSM